jgi:hypothetical protein
MRKERHAFPGNKINASDYFEHKYYPFGFDEPGGIIKEDKRILVTREHKRQRLIDQIRHIENVGS